MKVGLKTISEVSGFSLATVSNVLNGKKGVNAQTGKKIVKIARDLGYFKDKKVDKVKLVIYKKHGLIVDETPFFNELIEGVSNECRGRGLALEIVNVYASEHDFPATLNQLLNDYTSAVLLLATELDKQDLQQFENATIPVALLDSWHPEVNLNATIINNEDSLSNAVTFFASQGYKTFGYLKSSVPIRNFHARYEGFLRGVAGANATFSEEHLVSLKPNAEGAYLDMLTYLGTNPTLPQIFLADNDIIALGAMKALKEKGVKIPHDLGIVGFDDMPYCELSSPTLSTMGVYKRELGAQGVRNLIDNIGGASPMNIKVEISTQLILRESVLLD